MGLDRPCFKHSRVGLPAGRQSIAPLTDHPHPSRFPFCSAHHRAHLPQPFAGALTTVAVLALILIIFSSISILQFEAEAPGANIITAEDALWWSYVTITTIGYGDKFPVTTEGRIVAVVLMTAGVGLFGTFTAFVSSWLLAERKGEKADQDVASRLD